MTASPFFITGPAIIQVSGGRTSAYMLRRILDAHDGRLPADVHVCFQNTGLEHPATYRFVERLRDWGTPIRWIEWRPDAPGFEEVGPNSADRGGVWFRRLIEDRRFLPNSVSRFCTTVLKIRAATAFMKAEGYAEWTTVVGIRKDEPHRIAKGRARNEGGKDPFDSIWPLDAAGIRKADVLAFFATQAFDLELPSDSFGNCMLCHLKAREKLLEVMLAMPETAGWWVTMEALVTDLVARGLTKMVTVETLWGEEEIPAGPAGPAAARFRREGPTYAELSAYCRDYPEAAQREVDAYKEKARRGEAQMDLLENCMCGVG